MKNLLIISLFVWGLCCGGTSGADVAKDAKLDVVQLREIPTGVYEAHLQYVGRGEKVRVRISIKNNRATLVEASSEKFKGLSGRFELIGNGVFLAQLKFNAGRASQFWIFHSDGSATIKEIPDRGEKQTAKRISEE